MLNSLILLAGASAFIAQGGYGNIPSPPQIRLPAPATTAPQKQATPPRPAAQAVVPGRALKDLPNTTVRYYDVSGDSIAALRQAITAQRPKDASGQPMAASSNWKVDATFTKRTTNAQCEIAAARATFQATADLPRLANPQALKPEELASWNSYVADLEASTASSLWFVQDRIGQVEKAILASSCDQASSVGAAAVEQLRTQLTEFRRSKAAAAAAAAATPPSQ